MIAVHAALGNALLLLLLVCLGWSTLGIFSGRGVAPGLRSSLLLALGVSVGQLLLGLSLIFLAGRSLSWLHLLYGLALIVSLAGAAIYGSRTTAQREVLIYALVSAWSAGLALRAMETVARFE